MEVDAGRAAADSVCNCWLTRAVGGASRISETPRVRNANSGHGSRFVGNPACAGPRKSPKTRLPPARSIQGFTFAMIVRGWAKRKTTIV
jgi:hypothetical protein